MTISPPPAQKIIILLYGGPSQEFSVSCHSACGMLVELEKLDYFIYPILITKACSFIPCDPRNHLDELTKDQATPTSVKTRVAILSENQLLFEYKLNSRGNLDPSTLRSVGQIALAIPLLHGTYGEDGTIQGYLDSLQVPYLGCDQTSSLLSFNKALTKLILAQAKIPQVDYHLVDYQEWKTSPRLVADKLKQTLPLPWFVKPARQGSSVGITKVEDYEELKLALDLAHEFDHLVVVEQGLTARELECGVIEAKPGELITSALGEIKVQAGEFYTYENKYEQTQNVELIIPAKLPAHLVRRIEEMSKKTFQALGAKGLARIDFFYEEEKDKLYLNEINTMPGFTAHSMFARLFAEVGLSYSELLEKLIQNALIST